MFNRLTDMQSYTFKLICNFSKARYSLIVLKVPLNPNQSVLVWYWKSLWKDLLLLIQKAFAISAVCDAH